LEEDSFFRLREEINMDEGHVTAVYYLETPLEPSRAAEALAAEQSTGTWLRVHAETAERRRVYGAKIIGLHELPKNEGEPHKCIVEVAFPVHNFGPRLPNLLSTVAGNLFEMKDFLNIRLLDLHFSKDFTASFKGPKFGLKGTREALGVEDRPLIGSIIKPCVGLRPKELAELCYQAARGGVDFLKDDELYGPCDYSPLEDRVSEVMEALDRANSEKGERTLYAVNITDEVDRILDNADLVQRQGANCIMLNFVTTGFSALRMLAEDPSVKVPIHAHRDMFAAFTRYLRHGISPVVVTKLCRIAGGDQIHIGAIQGKLYEKDEDVAKSAKICLNPMRNIAPALPVSSGGQTALTVPLNVKKLGKDALILAGGGVFGFPTGPTDGARSMRQALKAFEEGIPLEEYAKDHRELMIALQTWGKRI
jgi:ribulose-bisphosphate carboxylase large chain